MDLTSIFQQSSLAAPSDLALDAILPLIFAGVLGFAIRAVYKKTPAKRTKINNDIANAIPVLAMIVTFVVIAIGGSLVHAVSLLGTLALIRFRTKVKSVQDMSYIFLSVGIGIASGLQMYAVSIVGAFAILFVLGILYAHGERSAEGGV